MKDLKPDALVLSYEWYVPDNWYGKNYRVILTPDINGFNNAKETKQYKSWLSRYIKDKCQVTNKGITKEMSFGPLSNKPTYIYCGAGPSYSCSNRIISVNYLTEYIERIESTPEWQEKQRMNEYKAENRKMLKERKLQRKARIKREYEERRAQVQQ